MGHFNAVCLLSRLPVQAGEACILVELAPNRAGEPRGTYELARAMGQFNTDAFAPLIELARDLPGDEGQALQDRLQNERQARQDDPPYHFLGRGTYDHHGGLDHPGGHRRATKPAFFVHTAVWAAAVAWMRAENAKDVFYRLPDHWAPPSDLDAELLDVLNYCFVAGVQVGDTSLLGCQDVEPITLRAADHLAQITRTERLRLGPAASGEDTP